MNKKNAIVGQLVAFKHFELSDIGIIIAIFEEHDDNFGTIVFFKVLSSSLRLTTWHSSWLEPMQNRKMKKSNAAK